jgi:hypothetical protein
MRADFALGELGIMVITAHGGRSCIGAYVELETEEEALRAAGSLSGTKVGGRAKTSRQTTS